MKQTTLLMCSRAGDMSNIFISLHVSSYWQLRYILLNLLLWNKCFFIVTVALITHCYHHWVLDSELISSHHSPTAERMGKYIQAAVYNTWIQFSTGRERQCTEKADMCVRFHACLGEILSGDTYLPWNHIGRNQRAVLKVPQIARSCRDKDRWDSRTGGPGIKKRGEQGTEGWMKRKQVGEHKHHWLDLGRMEGGQRSN